MDIDEMQVAVHELAREKGWWDTATDEQSLADRRLACLADVHAAVSDAAEEVRDGGDPEEIWKQLQERIDFYGDTFKNDYVPPGSLREQFRLLGKFTLIHTEVTEAFRSFVALLSAGSHIALFYMKDKHGQDKPEGVVIELADVVIRILDLCARTGLSLSTAIHLKHRFNAGRKHRHGGRLA